MRHHPLRTAFLAVLLAAPLLHAQRQPVPGNDFHALFSRRVKHSERQLNEIVRAAETSAVRCITGTNVLINVPYHPQASFAEEILNRSGGLVNALPTIERPKLATSNDIVLFSIASWEADAAKAIPLLESYRSNNWMIVLFASTAGAPQAVRADWWIDNGAASGDNDESDLNVLANALNGWLWCLEYTAALTRHGKFPGILQGILEVGADDHDKRLRDTGRPTLYEMRTPIPKLRLARSYLWSVKRVLYETGEDNTRDQIEEAAALLAEHIQRQGKVVVASCTHILISDIHRRNKSPWKPINVVWQTESGVFENNAGTNDYIVWFGYIGLSTKYEDYGGYIRKTGAKLIASYSPDTYSASNNAPEAQVVIEQSWAIPDSVVTIPFPPGHMAPVSGIEAGLLYRMLDEAVYDRLGRRSGE
jgi:uncharacterized phosphosugar-binding protein